VPTSESTTDEQDTVGSALRAAREAMGLTVEQVAASTRIRATLVRDLEADRYASSGAPVYARGHIRNIAGTVGADAAALVARFDREVGAEAPPIPVIDAPVVMVPTQRLALPVAGAPDRRGPNWAVAGVAAVGALVALIAVGTVADDRRGTGATRLGAVGALPSSEPTTTPDPLKSEATATVPTFDGADLRVRVIGGASWVRVRDAARKTLFEGVLSDGQSKDFRDRTALDIVVGNAGAVSIVCSGKDLARAGGNGKIARFSCRDTGLVSA
jgi:cytoskeleton protein RodZ